ncbi:MAG: C4-dicarboxylate-specific signal transduction histidine kinase [Cognaticolwellia sp.]|jgi:C4-dicarboxylate-specific signal transduction histidine kinase
MSKLGGPYRRTDRLASLGRLAAGVAHEVRLVFVTGGAYTEDARAFVERDDVRCLAKPFRMSEVRALVASVVNSD